MIGLVTLTVQMRVLVSMSAVKILIVPNVLMATVHSTLNVSIPLNVIVKLTLIVTILTVSAMSLLLIILTNVHIVVLTMSVQEVSEFLKI